jgi:hypothetical protein
MSDVVTDNDYGNSKFYPDSLDEIDDNSLLLNSEIVGGLIENQYLSSLVNSSSHRN